MDLANLRRRIGLLTLGLVWLLVPAIGLSGWAAGSSPLTGTALAFAIALAASASAAGGAGAPLARNTLAAAVVCAISVLVWVAPSLLRIDMHMLYFAALALLAGFCDPVPILIATVVTAVHHLGLDLLLPLAVFPDAEYGLLRVAVHAAILLLEAGALVLVATGIQRAALAAVAEATTLADQASVAARVMADAHEQSDIAARAQVSRQSWATALDADLTDVASRVSGSAGRLDETVRRVAGFVRDAAGETAAASQAAQAAGTNAQTVAAAVEELAASIGEITRQVDLATSISERAVQQARETDKTVGGLAEGAQRIGDVVRLISEIAAQTNLLALNATIEAARAGEAGRGFAVVAGEVKSLAAQTARATEEIGQQIAGIRATTERVVADVRSFGAVVIEVEQVAASIAGAVGEQRAAAQESASAAADIAERTAEATQAVERAAAAFAPAAEALTTLQTTATDLAGAGSALRERLTASLARITAA